MADVSTYRGKPFAECSDEELVKIPEILARDVARVKRSLARELSMARLFSDPVLSREAHEWNTKEAEKNRSIGKDLAAELEHRLAEKGV